MNINLDHRRNLPRHRSHWPSKTIHPHKIQNPHSSQHLAHVHSPAIRREKEVACRDVYRGFPKLSFPSRLTIPMSTRLRVRARCEKWDTRRGSARGSEGGRGSCGRGPAGGCCLNTRHQAVCRRSLENQPAGAFSRGEPWPKIDTGTKRMRLPPRRAGVEDAPV